MLLAPEIVERKGLPKEIIMQMPAILEGESLTRLCQGAAAGAVATMIIGFAWGGWTLGSTAKADAVKSAASAVVAVLAPICADKFKHAADAPANMAELKKVSTWQQEKHRNIVHYVGDTSNGHQHTKDARKKGGAKSENADQDAVESEKQDCDVERLRVKCEKKLHRGTHLL
jgi:hypothetical protein